MLGRIGVDACMVNLMRPGMYGAYHRIPLNLSLVSHNYDVEYIFQL